MERIDAHQHYWKPGRGDYGGLTPDSPAVLYRDYLPADLRPELAKCGIDRTILVQAATTHEETSYMLGLSDEDDSIAGVVGWIDFDNAGWREVLDGFRRHPKFVGFRLMIQDMEDPSQMLRDHVIGALREVAAMDLPVDIVCYSRQLPVVLELLRRVPDLRAVVDHICKPEIAAGVFEPWASQMREIADYPKLYCKLSGLVTEADHQSWTTEDFTRYVGHVLDLFGTGRVMYGSDWPVCLMAGSYEQVYGLLAELLPDSLTEAELAAIYGGNAADFYKLERK